MFVEKNGEKFVAPSKFAQQASVGSLVEYRELYERSIREPDQFWGEIAQEFYWQRGFTRVRDFNFNKAQGPVRIEWFADGQTNIAFNCLDRHLEQKGHKTAIIWEGNAPGESRTLSYRELHEKVCRFSNVLRSRGVVRGDRVAIYMPMVPELAIAVLACARIGAIHSVVFAGFSAASLADRIVDCRTKILITADVAFRADKKLPIKEVADEAMAQAATQGQNVETCIVYRRGSGDISCLTVPQRDFWWHDLEATVDAAAAVEWMNAEDPLFILYTSGSTGKPKGALHTTAGYMVYVATTFRYVFDHKENDVHFCTADLGWVTGHSYVVYGPLLNGATTVMFEGVPNWPDSGRFWEIVDKYKVSIFYTAPTAIRALEAQGDEWVKRYSRQSLRLLGSVGEPINPAAWNWYHKVVGEERCPIVDTWWQTETGGILISPLPGAIPTKPGSATLPFFGVEPKLLHAETGKEITGAGEGVLVISASWPGQMRSVYGDHRRFEETYFQAYAGHYFTGDGCRRDADGYYWITGRVDDVINVSGHRFGTAEIESALVAYPEVTEAAVVGYPHEIKGMGIYAYVTLVKGAAYDDATRRKLIQHVRKVIGAIAAPDEIHWAPQLPKTRSGKIMRRILRKIAAGEMESIGDTSTLADPTVVQDLINSKTSSSKS